ncbi:MAG TPA: transcriptional regulator NrdR [Deltaproteobacteria bacterium]|jgi:transcriptional repressor NrdR|nr:transcriptional regulator NrdR [Deltaproteobacteria bacterium]HOI07439.1 transcriptional regulator NrdR [Deltaproteobacteria bacterium]
MRCPRCSGLEDKVIQSRISRDGGSIRRRRECTRCSHRFTTYEKIEENLPLVIKKDGRREAFDPNKVISGITTACEKRPVSIEDIESVKESIIHDIQAKGDREVPSSYIGERVMEALSKLDPVAYVRFASVYREFKDVGDFVKEIQKVDESKP